MKRRLSALILTGLGTGALLAASPDRAADAEPAADPAAVDQYLAQLSAMKPPVADPELAKRAASLDRAEPMIDAAVSTLR